MLKKLIFGFLVIASFSGCLKSDIEDPCEYDPCATKATAAEIQSVQDYLNANSIVATQHCSGIFYVVDIQGNGATPQVCSNVTVNYEGKLTNGTVFDASSSPVTFNLSQVIKGFKNGMLQVKSGGSIRIFIPPSLGYGEYQQGNIPANSILIFTVTLVSVQ